MGIGKCHAESNPRLASNPGGVEMVLNNVTIRLWTAWPNYIHIFKSKYALA